MWFLSLSWRGPFGDSNIRSLILAKEEGFSFGPNVPALYGRFVSNKAALRRQ